MVGAAVATLADDTAVSVHELDYPVGMKDSSIFCFRTAGDNDRFQCVLGIRERG